MVIEVMHGSIVEQDVRNTYIGLSIWICDNFIVENQTNVDGSEIVETVCQFCLYVSN